jgi:hypothetical protein
MTPSPWDEHLLPGHNHDLRKRLGRPTRAGQQGRRDLDVRARRPREGGLTRAGLPCLARHISPPVNCACLGEGGREYNDAARPHRKRRAGKEDDARARSAPRRTLGEIGPAPPPPGGKTLAQPQLEDGGKSPP